MPETLTLGLGMPVSSESTAAGPGADFGELVHIPLDLLVPREDQARQHFGDNELRELADSILANGILTPLTVRAIGNGKYDLLAGHRRRRAAYLAGLDTVPCIVRGLDDTQAEEVIVYDNLSRENLLPWEEGFAYTQLMRKGISPAALAKKTGHSEQYIADRVTISQQAGDAAREAHMAGTLSLGALRVLCDLPDRQCRPVDCPGCHRINGEGVQQCPACGYDLSTCMRFAVGNPQQVAAKALSGKPAWQVAEIVRKVRESYGIGEAPVQTSLGICDYQLSRDTLATRTKLLTMLENVAGVEDYLTRHGASLAKLTNDQREACIVQAQCGIRALELVIEKVKGK